MARRLHQDEISISLEQARRLVAGQFPEYAGLPLRELKATGSTNRLFRLGDNLLLRLPRQPGGGAGIDKEWRYLPEMGRRLPVAIPGIVAVGQPAEEFPERWSIVRWLEGAHPPVPPPQPSAGADRAPSTAALAEDLAAVILALRAGAISAEAAADPELRWYRGRSLAEFDAHTRRNLERCRAIGGLALDLDAALAVWNRALDLPGAHQAGADCWYHGDLVAENLLLRHGRLAAVLDFGCLSIGDPTVDLHGAWEVLDAPARALFRRRLGIENGEWLRGRAWALALALGTFTYYWSSMPGRCRDRLAMARAVLADAERDGT